MRIPMSRVYRAFPELDRFTDDECERYVSFVSQRAGCRNSFISVVAAVCVTIVAPILGAMVFSAVRLAIPPRLRDLVPIVVIAMFACGPLVGLLTRDRLLRNGIRDRLKHARCPACEYSLVGLTIMQGHVKCPECGLDIELTRHDITQADLVAERTAPAYPTSANPSDSP